MGGAVDVVEDVEVEHLGVEIARTADVVIMAG